MRDEGSRAVFFVVLGLLLLGCGERKALQERPDVLLLTIDTLRADFVHAYGFLQDTTPNMDSLARRGALFEEALAASSRTVPSHASIMTSRWVREHSVGSFNGATRLDGVETLAERFREAGYDTAAFVSNFVLKRRTGLDRGFTTYDDEMVSSETHRHGHFERIAEETATRAIAWLDSRDRRPFFLWVHLQDPHGPYAPPSSFADRVGPVATRTDRELPVLSGDAGRAGIPRYQAIGGEVEPGFYATRYAGEVAYTDHWVGQLVAAFERASQNRESIILLTADHGESLGENGLFFQHGEGTAPEQVRVPLLLVGPGVAALRSVVPVSHVDIAPTLVDMAGLAPDPRAQGLSLRRLLASSDPPPERTLYTETARSLRSYRGDGSLEVRPGVGASLHNPLDPEGALRFFGYERREDGRWAGAVVSERLREEMQAHLHSRAVPISAAGELDDEDKAQLRALGYLPESP